MRYFIASLFSFLFLLNSFAQAPTSQFSGTPLTVCLGQAVNFSDLSTAGGSPISSWNWDFGDGNASTQINPSHTYAAPGIYTVTLVVTAQNGQADAEVKANYITVNPLPNVDFTTSGNGCSVPFDVTFINNSDSGSGITYNWDFGNGQTSTQQNPTSVTYSSFGTFTVSLTVTNSATGCSNSISNDIVVSDYQAAFNAPLSACVGSSVSFTDVSTVGTNSWNWNFGDGLTSNQQNPTHIYTSPGNYTITLTTQNTSSGCSDIFTQDIVINDLPTPSFTEDVTIGCAPLDVNFTNTSVGGVTYQWNFGNGNTFTGANPPTETYNADGMYTVSLTMTDANGCTATVIQNNLINVSAPFVQFSMDQYHGCDPLTVQFNESSVSPDPTGDPIITWLWDFGDGSPVSSGQVPPAHVYNEGVYSVTLTVETQNGCQGTLTLTDTIQVGSIVNVDFTVDPTIQCAKTGVDFIDGTTFNGTPDPGDVDYHWDFGDGGTSTEQSPTYPYPSDTGYFDVTLIVEWRGCADTLTVDNAVYIKAPISIFSPNQTLFCNPSSLPITVNVTDNSIIGEIPDDVEMVWKWGDGTFTYFDDIDVDDADQGATSHNYTAYGTYTIEQVIYNHTTGCSDSTTATISVSQTDASFTLSNDSTCVGSPVTLTNTSTSTHSFGTYVYTMGNGNTISGSTVSYIYNTSGSYTITLTATNNVGCSDNEIFVGFDALALPQAGILPSATTGCAPVTVNYQNTSSAVGNGVPLQSFLWTFPDLTTQVTNNVSTQTSFDFDAEGVFTTTLVATDQFGCVSPAVSVNMTITKPTAEFLVDDVVCDNENFVAVNQSINGTGYDWFVDGNLVSNTTDFSNSFDEVTSQSSNNVPHTIQLITTDINGCKDTVVHNVVVSMPRADIDYSLFGASVNTNGDFTCPPVFASFTDMSDAYGNISSWSWDFGDGKSSTLQDPDNTYVFSGTYSASLHITDEFGCTSDTILVDFLTISGPSGDPQWTDFGDICGQTIIFSADNLDQVDQIIWDLGDGTTVNDTNTFNHTYTSYDSYSPTATLLDNQGCEVIYTLPPIDIVNNGLHAYFVPTPDAGPIGTTFELDEASTYLSAPIVTWTWILNGDTTVMYNSGDIIQPFGLPGIYPITIIVTDANGCVDTYSTIVTITNEFNIPNVITINDDGLNDLFTLPAAVFKSFDLVIVNRWGNVVQELNSATGIYLWDGRAQSGKPVSEGTYFYYIKGTLFDGTFAERQGFVTVIQD